MTGLAGFTARMAGRLSGGMKQKLGLACTLVRSPDLLLLDEPTVGVDPVSRRELWAIIDHLTRAAGMSVLFSTAYLDEAERCDSVLLLHQGRLLAAGPPGEMTAPLAGRVFAAPVPAAERRRTQTRLAAQPGVIDAVIQGGGVRLVLAQAPTTTTLDGLTLAAVPPRFEDGFVARLRALDDNAAASAGAVAATPPAMADAGGDVIVVEHLTRRFGAFVAVRDVSFRVRRGEIFGLLGANGAGKSTCFRMLCGLLPASEGRLEVAGFDLRRAAAPARGQIGYMAQKFSLYGDLSVRQNLRFFAAAYGLRGALFRERIDWAVGEFDLGPMLGGNARDLPLGFKQRLALACALMHQPRILFLDEPTSGVDPLARREFWRRITGLAESGVTVLVTTHFMEEAEYCDRLVIMAQGAVLAAGSPDEIKENAGGGAATMEDAFIAVIEAATSKVAA
jgi:ABC-2 type transport system ATP-binding protein